MRILLIDDETLAVRELERLLREIDTDHFIKDIYLCTQGCMSVEMVKKYQPDVVFLDISMPGTNGITIAEQILDFSSEIEIVFVTAYNQFAIKAFEINAIDYVLKPIHPDRLKKTISRLFKLRSQTKNYTSSTQSHVLVRCFGQFQLETNIILDIPWRTAKAQELLAYFILHRKKPIHKDILIEVLWPESDPIKSITYLYTTVYQLKKTLHEFSIDAHISNKNGYYYIEIEGLIVDVELWESKLLQYTNFSPETVEVHQEVVQMYKEDYLSNHDYYWAEEEKERLKMLWYNHCLLFVQYLNNEEKFEDAINILNHLVHKFPDSEKVYWYIMKIYSKLEEWQNVDKYYQRLVQMLKDDFDSTPSRHISDWYEETWKHR